MQYHDLLLLHAGPDLNPIACSVKMWGPKLSDIMYKTYHEFSVTTVRSSAAIP